MTNHTTATSNPFHPTPRRTSRLRAGLVACAVGLALLGAACSSSKPKVSTGANSDSPTTTTTIVTTTTVAKAGGSGGVGF